MFLWRYLKRRTLYLGPTVLQQLPLNFPSMQQVSTKITGKTVMALRWKCNKNQKKAHPTITKTPTIQNTSFFKRSKNWCMDWPSTAAAQLEAVCWSLNTGNTARKYSKCSVYPGLSEPQAVLEKAEREILLWMERSVKFPEILASSAGAFFL